MLDCPRTQSGREVHQPTCLHQPNLNRVQFETRRFQFRSSPPLGDLGRLVLRVSNWTRFRTTRRLPKSPADLWAAFVRAVLRSSLFPEANMAAASLPDADKSPL